MSKRAPLSQVSGSALNSRASVGGSSRSLSTGGQNKRMTATSESSRLSSASVSSFASNRKSVGGIASIKSMKINDPRDITSKSFQTNAKKLVFEYLAQNSFDQPIVSKSPQLTLKEYTSIIHFLSAKFDPCAKFSQKIEDDTIILLGRLQYPFKITKQVFQSHTLKQSNATILAAVAWMVELLNFESIAGNPQVFEDPNHQLDYQLYEITSQYYREFISGKDVTEDLRIGIHGLFDQQLSSLKSAIDILYAEGGQMDLIIESASSEQPELERLGQIREDKFNYVREIERYIEQSVMAKEAHIKTLAQQKPALEKSEREVAELVKEEQEKQKTLEYQKPISVDLKRINSRHLMARDTYRELSQTRLNMQQKIADGEDMMDKQFANLLPLVDEYRRLSEDILIRPINAKYSNGQDWSIRVDLHARPAQAMLNMDISTTLKPYILSLKEKFVGNAHNFEMEANDLKQKIEAIQDSEMDTVRSIESIKSQIEKVENEQKNEKDLLQTEVQKIEKQREIAEADIEDLQMDHSEEIAQLERELELLGEEHSKTRANQEAERLGAQQGLMKLVKMLSEHKTHIERELGELENYFNGFLGKMAD